MKRQFANILLALALLEALGMSIFWAAKGANTGWTKTQIEVVTIDEVTGLEARNWEDRFVPGIELLGAGWLSGIALAGVALFIRKTTDSTPHKD